MISEQEWCDSPEKPDFDVHGFVGLGFDIPSS